MKLCYWNRVDQIPNFGDVLNPYIFKQLLPTSFDGDLNSIFVGIGTLLETGIGEKLNIPLENLTNGEPNSKHIIVFGSGAGYSDPPNIDPRWKIYCVRGPLTADLLGLDKKYSVADPAILIRRLYKNCKNKTHRYSLIPHHSSSTHILKKICDEIGINYIDPLSPVENILDDISATEILLTEALHGAIVADALRTPWIPIQIKPKFFNFKWEDWCKSINIDYHPTSTSNIIHRIWENNQKPSLSGLVKRKFKYAIAENNLKNIARNTKPVLSQNNVIENLTQELESRIELFKKDISNGNYV